MLLRVVQVSGVAGAAAVLIPSIVSAVSPAAAPARRRPRWRRLGPLDGFPVGAVREAVIGHQARGSTGPPREARSPTAAPPPPPPELAEAVYVWRPSAERVVVFSRACTDLGCPVNYDPGSQFYYCPCHGGIFNRSGEPVAGPPPRPLYQYATRVRRGVLEIDVHSVPVPA